MILHQEITHTIIQSFYKVYNTLGYGFLEKVYENVLLLELREQGLTCERQFPIEVYYNDKKVGEYYADIIVGQLVIIENKAAEAICKEHECQLINYLKATNIEVGLLLNFGKEPEFRRKVFSKAAKKNYQR